MAVPLGAETVPPEMYIAALDSLRIALPPLLVFRTVPPVISSRTFVPDIFATRIAAALSAWFADVIFAAPDTMTFPLPKI